MACLSLKPFSSFSFIIECYLPSYANRFDLIIIFLMSQDKLVQIRRTHYTQLTLCPPAIKVSRSISS